MNSIVRQWREEASTSTVGRVSFAVLIAVVASGCAIDSSNEVRRPAPPVPLSERSEPTAKTLSPGSPPEPARPQEQTQPQEPTRSSETAPRQGTDEPDPRAVIDWLLKRDTR